MARIPQVVKRLLVNHALKHPYAHILGVRGGKTVVYMERYWLVQPHWWTFGCSARIHVFHRSDVDRTPHDHPWANISWILYGAYVEETHHIPQFPAYRMEWLRAEGDIVFRNAEDYHRVRLLNDCGDGFGDPVTTLFLMGPWRQVWGFITPTGKVPHYDYDSAHYLDRPISDSEGRWITKVVENV